MKGFRAGLLVEDKVIVELKSVEKLVPVHSKQGATPLESAAFGATDHLRRGSPQKGIERIVNDLPTRRLLALVTSWFHSLRP